jgi:hypothetical protein
MKNNRSILCAYIKSPDGTRIRCEVLESFIYNPYSLLPMMIVRGIEKRLNPINRAIIPMGNLFMQAVKS